MRKTILLLLLLPLFGCTRLEQAAAVPLPTLEPSSSPQTPALPPAGILPTATLVPLSVPGLASSPSPALSAATFTATPPPPTLTPTPTPTSRWRRTWTPSPTPTITLTPTLDVTTHIQLRIVLPGPLSKVVSPIQFVAHIDPDYTGLTRIELIGEDGRELYRKVFRTYSNIGYFTRVDEKVTFELKGAAEMARLQISTFDNQGNMLAFNSVRLMLFSAGETQLSPSYPAQERVGLHKLKREAEISGGVLELEGEINPINNTPVIFELFDEDGRIVGSRLIQLSPAAGKFQPFLVSIPYQLTERTAIRLVIRQADDRISGLAYLYSLPIFLSP